MQVQERYIQAEANLSFVAKVRWSLLSNSSLGVEEGGEGKRDSSNQGKNCSKKTASKKQWRKCT